MALSQAEKDRIKELKEEGKSLTEIMGYLGGNRVGRASSVSEEELQTFRENQQASVASHEPELAERFAKIGTTAAENIKDQIQGTGEFEGQSNIRRSVGATATAFNVVPQAVTELLPSPIRKGIESVGDVISSGFKKLTDFIGSSPTLQRFVQENPDVTKALEDVTGTLASAGVIAGDILAVEGARAGVQKTADLSTKVATKVGETVARTADDISAGIAQARPATMELMERSKSIIKPKSTPTEAVGEILQGGTKDVAKGVQAFDAIDTTGVKTYAELAQRLDDNIGMLSRKVDDVLAQDPTPIPLSQLTTKTTTEGGRVVSRNYVETSLSHLKELYQKTADDAALANLDDLIEKANTTGLTRLEVNDISRLYNIEFGSKAFNKMGDPLTSVNAQMYENIRGGLKDVARQGMGGTEAAATDKIISSLYNTKSLVDKNVEAVNKLTQKIAERGLVEKFGYTLSKYADILTGGSIRGFIGGILPRGAGYKVMNALDLEQRLADNLEIIRKAIESGSDEAIGSAIKQLDASLVPGEVTASQSSLLTGDN